MDLAVSVHKKFRRIYYAMRKHRGSIERATGVSGAQLWALTEISRTPGMRVRDLARELAIHQSSASNMVDQLEQKGLIRRRRGEQDHRAVYLGLTSSGEQTVRRAPTSPEGILQQALAQAPEALLQELDRDLCALLKRLKAHAAQGEAGSRRRQGVGRGPHRTPVGRVAGPAPRARGAE